MGRSHAEKAIEFCDQILNQIDELPDNSDAIEYGSSIQKTVTGIRKNIEEYDNVTEGQQSALDNINNGLDAWFEN